MDGVVFQDPVLDMTSDDVMSMEISFNKPVEFCSR